ncbi:MAG: hypothetical protein OEY74_07975 [Gammaproteobacteria bacterium]|nr:hypothetical protein [Gammaproteobacteria bacterium]
MNRLIRVTTVTLLLANSVALADDVIDDGAAKPWIWSVSGGITAWENLGNIQSLAGEDFDDVGLGFEFAVHKRVSTLGSADVFLGVDVGYFGADSDIRGLYGDLVQRGLYLTPSVKLGFGEHSRFFLEAGAGWYNVDLAEFSCYALYTFCLEPEVVFDSNAFGTYLGFRAPLGRLAFLGLRMHQADFGQVSGINAPLTRLEGPFYSLFVGAGF